MRFAIIGNIEGSRNITSMKDTLKKLQYILDEVNKKYKDDIVIPFELTIGDEFQALLKKGDNILKMIHHIKLAFYPHQIRYGLGVGKHKISDKHGADGKVWWRARDAIMFLKLESKKKNSKQESRILLNTSQNEVSDLINASLNVLASIEEHWTDRQREILNHVVDKYAFSIKIKQTELADELEMTPPTLNKHLKSMNYFNYVSMIEKIDQVMNSYEWID